MGSHHGAKQPSPDEVHAQLLEEWQERLNKEMLWFTGRPCAGSLMVDLHLSRCQRSSSRGLMIPGFEGVFANASQLEDCRNLLEEVLEEWLLFRLAHGLSTPVVDGLDLKFKKVETA